MPHLAVTILGNRNSGKSSTWNALFGGTVRTGKSERKLYLNKAQFVKVFLVSGSPEEREEYVGEILTVKKPAIVLCSTQYTDTVHDTYDFFFDNGYEVHVQWLNPGYRDRAAYKDHLNLLPYLLSKGAVIKQINGQGIVQGRCQNIVQTILGWAHYHGLLETEFEF